MSPNLTALDPAQAFRPSFRVEVDSGEALDVRDFSVHEALDSLFTIHLSVRSPDADIDLEGIVGRRAVFSIGAQASAGAPGRSWEGICNHMEMLRVEPDGLSTYRLVIVPRLWLLSQRRNYRIFQHKSEPEIVKQILEEWEIEPELRIDEQSYRARKYRVQYAESDLAFVSRMLEDAGIAYFFEEKEGETKLVLCDRVQGGEPRAMPLPFVDSPSGRSMRDFVTAVRVSQRVRPGRYTLRDVDYRRRSDFPLAASAHKQESGIESRLERFHFVPGAFVYSSDASGDTPAADDRGAARADLELGQRQANLRLEAKRSAARVVTFVTSAADLRPGVVFSIAGHPRTELGADRSFFVATTTIEGDTEDPWIVRCEARPTTSPYRPPLATPKPRTQGVESATVVGPAGEEIHTDEFGRVRVQFHWDREGQRDERSSCWLPVSQAWGGASFGAVNLPRVGQEVLVDFLNADPDRPVVVGRVFTRNQPTPYALPANRTVSGLRSESSPRGRSAPPRPAPGPRSSPLGGGQAMDDAAIDEAVTTPSPFRATSPAGATHRWSGSEITFRDSAGSELLYLQAQRDFHSVTKNDRAAVIGNNDSTLVGADRLVRIRNSEQIDIGMKQETRIGDSSKTTVQNDILVESVAGSERHIVSELFSVASKDMILSARQSLILQVGSSMIVMRPDCILIESPHVFINPGMEAVDQAVLQNTRPATPQEMAAEQAQREAALERRQQVGVRPYDPAARPQGRAEEARAALNRSQQRAGGMRLPPAQEREYFDQILEGQPQRFTPAERSEAIEQWLRDNPRTR